MDEKDKNNIKKQITKKKAILKDFGIKDELIEELFKNANFKCLRALDLFTDSIIKKSFADSSMLIDDIENVM